MRCNGINLCLRDEIPLRTGGVCLLCLDEEIVWPRGWKQLNEAAPRAAATTAIRCVNCVLWRKEAPENRSWKELIQEEEQRKRKRRMDIWGNSTAKRAKSLIGGGFICRYDAPSLGPRASMPLSAAFLIAKKGANRRRMEFVPRYLERMIFHRQSRRWACLESRRLGRFTSGNTVRGNI
ncbi:hypothetical protein K438DRAFT_1772372 [Mycena galopus ATCC 62051]|nr:hypothetical protein K438DRAFT_1772372 [Mycena galopus ATCC 62051]